MEHRLYTVSRDAALQLSPRGTPLPNTSSWTPCHVVLWDPGRPWARRDPEDPACLAPFLVSGLDTLTLAAKVWTTADRVAT